VAASPNTTQQRRKMSVTQAGINFASVSSTARRFYDMDEEHAVTANTNAPSPRSQGVE